MPEASALAVRKSITVDAPVEVAFEVFTSGIASWWPVETHKVGAGTAMAVTMEGRQGGRLFETSADGTEHDWGHLTAWEPPARVAFTWHPGYDDPTQHTDVEVTFVAEGAGTRVELVHVGWERLGERAAETVRGYDNGWNLVLGRYTAAAANRGG
jgi:uncharacterized protein YndB with AHSA1/START domain